MNLIDKRKLIEDLIANVAIDEAGESPECRYFQVMKIIESQPTVEPKRGEWVNNPKSFVFDRVCSCCGYETLDNHWNYCPDCGAFMLEAGK